MIGLYKAIRDFRNDKLSHFVHLRNCVTRQIITAIKTATRQKHIPLNSYVSLNKPIYDEDSDRTYWMFYRELKFPIRRTCYKPRRIYWYWSENGTNFKWIRVESLDVLPWWKILPRMWLIWNVMLNPLTMPCKELNVNWNDI